MKLLTLKFYSAAVKYVGSNKFLMSFRFWLIVFALLGKAAEITFCFSAAGRPPWHFSAGPEVESRSGLHACYLLIRQQHADPGGYWQCQSAGWAPTLQWHHMQCVRHGSRKDELFICYLVLINAFCPPFTQFAGVQRENKLLREAWTALLVSTHR